MKAIVIFPVLFLVIFQVAVAEENDNCADAIVLEVGNQCTPTAYSNTSATAEPLSIVPDPPVFGKTIQSGELIYTCHLLIFGYGGESKWWVVFRKSENNSNSWIYEVWD